MANPLNSMPRTASRGRDLQRIAEGLRSAGEIFRMSQLEFLAADKDPGRVAALERAVDLHLQQFLPGEGEGWLSEESADDHVRLGTRRVWIVDPLDGTREFAAGIPEWSISIGLIEDGLPVAGGVYNPATEEIFLGSLENGVTLNGQPAGVRECKRIDQAVVLASRSEVSRGEWDHLQNTPFQVSPMGSVAYKLARVAAGLADATWTLVPKHEWDVAAGVALVRAGGGTIITLDGQLPPFNQPEPLFQGLLAFAGSGRRFFETDLRQHVAWS
jgi:myo-inositol-1(or 4)-monophosphatase